jgi:hypothetical protein
LRAVVRVGRRRGARRFADDRVQVVATLVAGDA